ncbi:DNA primase [Microbacteriaceae bacterium 4G12]
MGNRIPEEVVERVRQSVDIVDVIGEYVQLKKQGRNYFGLCPFHGEHTPSFSVAPDKQIFHCFGCGEGGNALSFLMKIDGLSFVEAVQKLGSKAGVNVTEYISEQDAKAELHQPSGMVEAHELLKKYYHHLLVNTQEGEIALAYLLERGITKDMIVKFEIGYASASWDHAVKVLQKRGFSLAVMEQAGLIVQSEKDGSYYDRFRNRIIFPIHNQQGKVVAFSGRTLGEDTPKYLNSPETPIFQKSKILYNFHQARSSIRKQQRILLFEGYADVLAAVKAGLDESVATMGTALTEEQARMIRRNVEQVVLCYDGDKAGQEATLKAGQMLLEVGCQVRVVSIPEKLDPDEYVRKYGEASFQKLVQANISFISFKIHSLRSGKNLQDESGKEAYVKGVLRELAQLKDPMQSESYLKSLAQEFSYSVETLFQQLHQYRNEQNQQSKATQIQTISKPIQTKPKLSGYKRAERELIYHALQNEDIAQELQPYLQYFHTEEHKGILYELYAYYEKGNAPEIRKFLDWLSDEQLIKIVTDISTDRLINPEYSKEMLEGSLATLQEHEQKLERTKHIFEVRKLEKEDPVAAAKFALEHIINKRKAGK